MTYENGALVTSATRVVLAIAMAGSCVFAQAETKDKRQPAAAPPIAHEEAVETELPPITVSAHEGIAVPYNQTGVDVTILEKAQMEKQQVRTLGDAMTRVPGVYILPGGGLNQRGYANRPVIRGLEGYDYTLPVLDGMRIQRTGSRVTSSLIGLMPMFDIGNTEVIKGAQGAVYGGGAVGGVVAINTPAGEGPATVKIFNEVGSFDSYTGYIAASGSEGKWNYYVVGGYEHTNNDMETPEYDPEMHSDHYGRFTQWAEAVRLGYRLSESARLTMTYRRQDSEYYGLVSNSGNDHMIYKHMSNLATMKLDAKIDKFWSSSLMAGYYGYDAKVGKPNNANLRSVQAEWRNALHWNEGNTTTAGLAWNRNEFSKEASGALYPSEPHNTENIYGFFAEHLVKPVRTWDNSFAVRIDHSDVWGNNFTYRYASSWKVTGEQSRTRLFGSVASGYRAPSWFQQHAAFVNGSNYYEGNPDLKLSKSLGGDLGVEQRLSGQHYFTLTGFWTRVNDAIKDSPSSMGKIDIGGKKYTVRKYQNVNYQTSVGFETALRGNFEDAWNSGYTLAYTYTESKGDDDRQWKTTARNVWSADLHTNPIDSVLTGIGFAAASGRRDAYFKRTDNYFVMRWYAQWQATDYLTFHIRVENLTNDRYVASAAGAHSNQDLLSVGTAVYGGFTLQF